MKHVQCLRQSLIDGQIALGTFLAELSAPGVVNILANCGLNFIMIDCEHGTYTIEQTRRLIETAQAVKIPALVRLPIDDRANVTRVLDAGASGILFPQVRTMNDVHEAVAMTKSPPLGQRGVHLYRPQTGFVVPADWSDYFEKANANLITAIQIETAGAASLADQIAATQGVDMLYIGPGDLRVNLGSPNQPDDPKVQQVIANVARSCRAHGKMAGCHFGSVDVLGQLIEQGYSVFGYSAATRLLANGTTALLDQVREATSASKQ